MTQPAHEWMLEIVQAAEELGYRIRYVGVDEIGLVRSQGYSYLDITLKGRFVNGKLLRDTLLPVEAIKP
jgi:hypothetical protein